MKLNAMLRQADISDEDMAMAADYRVTSEDMGEIIDLEED